jgi:hypothetical protein
MAITFSKEITGIYPAYNDSYIEFTSDLVDHNKAEIQAYPLSLFPKKFVIYPDTDGNYLFNLKESVKVVLNQNGFNDSNFDTSVYSKSITDLFLDQQQFDIEVFNDVTSETITKNYDFFKAVKQVGENISSNEYQLLSYSKDGVSHYLTYFEGFPFHFDILKVVSGTEITIKNLNNDITTDPFIPSSDGSFRLNIDKGGGENWTSDNVLPLIEGLNRLVIYEDGNFKTNLFVNKIKQCSGIYLKWMNRSGGYNHYLFNKFFVTQKAGVDLATVLNSDFNNIAETIGFEKSIGKESTKTINVKVRYSHLDFEILSDIFTSPSIQLYTSETAYIEGNFIDVTIEGSMSFGNKRNNNELAIAINLPALVTVKL